MKTQINYDGATYKVVVNGAVVSSHDTYGAAERELRALVNAGMAKL